MPAAVPTARMRAAGAASTTAPAMASSGLTCPAVPPPARTTEGSEVFMVWLEYLLLGVWWVGSAGAGGHVLPQPAEQSSRLLPAGCTGPGKGQEYTDGCQRHGQRRTAVGDERQRHSDHRQQAGDHRNIDEGLADDPDHDGPGEDPHEQGL